MFLYYFLQFWCLLKWTDDTELKYMHNTICGWQNIICCKNIEALLFSLKKFEMRVWDSIVQTSDLLIQQIFYELRFCVLIGLQASIKVYIYMRSSRVVKKNYDR